MGVEVREQRGLGERECAGGLDERGGCEHRHRVSIRLRVAKLVRGVEKATLKGGLRC
jgi:hypothetical protein